jgi:predicted RNase H-like nuclease
MLGKILKGNLEPVFGFRIIAPATLADNPKGDQFDALLCAIQAAWAWSRCDERYGAPETVDPLEGWIADPTLVAGSESAPHLGGR